MRYIFVGCECHCLREINDMKTEKEKLLKKVDALKSQLSQANETNLRMQMALSSSLLPTPSKPFKEMDGFPTNDMLLAWSVEARDSDYLFVKFVMMHLWPDGLANRSLTGRVSNNPKGRPRKTNPVNLTDEPTGEQGPTADAEPEPFEEPEAADGAPRGSSGSQPARRLALEPEKVTYIRGNSRSL